jgi:hypothetical protein
MEEVEGMDGSMATQASGRAPAVWLGLARLRVSVGSAGARVFATALASLNGQTGQGAP